MGVVERVSRRRIIDASDRISVGLEAMAGAVEAQDKIIGDTLKTVGDNALVAADARKLAEQALKLAIHATETLAAFRSQSFFERVAWLFRGPV